VLASKKNVEPFLLFVIVEFAAVLVAKNDVDPLLLVMIELAALLAPLNCVRPEWR
jgi:hypothetical protein